MLLSIRFGSGLNTRVALQDVNETEASGGENFDIVPGDSRLNWRKPFDLVSTCPAGQPIQGYAHWTDIHGGRYLLVQSGGYLYFWDGHDTWVQTALTVDYNARLRGTQASYWAPFDAVFIADIAGLAPVLIANAAGPSIIPFYRGADPMGFFRAKYILVANERVLFANIVEPAGGFPHLIVGSSTANPAIISTANRPSSALGAGDPWFLPSPDIRPINGFLKAFQSSFLMTQAGSIFELVGDSASDFAVSEFYTAGAPTGTEAYVFDGDDLIYGRHGRIESLRATQNYGDVATGDLSWLIGAATTDVADWRLVYNRTSQRLYAFPRDKAEVWVTSKHLYKSQNQLSPWVKWTTTHPLLFTPTCAFAAVAPLDGVEYTYMGDSFGNMYRMEGAGSGDGGWAPISGSFESKLFRTEGDGAAQNFRGQLDYVPEAPQSVTIRFTYAGEEEVSEAATLLLPGQTVDAWYWNDPDTFFGGKVYFNAAAAKRKRPRRQSFGMGGQSSHLQVSLESIYLTPYTIDAVELGYDARPSWQRA